MDEVRHQEGHDEDAGVNTLKLGEKEKPEKSSLREWVEAIVIAVVLALVIRVFIVEPYKIPSGSMENTLLIGDHLLVSKFLYGTHVPFTETVILPVRQPERGDIIVFKYPENENLDYIKRVIGLPGDILEIKDKVVHINGVPLVEPYTKFTDDNIRQPFISPRDNFGPVTVPEGHVFVMGDNRDNSHDSRFWGFVDTKKIKGKAFVLYWSWGGDNLVRWDRLLDGIN